jgi:DNA-directed RNA polymerase specialized sigma24 family protein
MQVVADVTLIEASRRGDRDGFAQIIERYQRAVYAVAFSGVRDRALADDVAQDTFVIAWRQLDQLRRFVDQPVRRFSGERIPRRVTPRHGGDAAAGGAREADVGQAIADEELSETESERIVAAALDRVPEVYASTRLYYYESAQSA